MKSNPGILDWQPPAHWTCITTIDMHTGGEPLRVYTLGLPPIDGRTVLEKRRYFLVKLVIETGRVAGPKVTFNVPAGASRPPCREISRSSIPPNQS